jgi:lipase
MPLYLHEWGDRAAPPLVCLHGVTGHGRRFRRLAEERLAERFRVLAPDLRGHGRSDWEPPWTLRANLADVLETVGAAGVDRAVWLGHSYGGRLILELAALEPDRIERAVLLDPAIQVLPHVALDLAELERRDASYESVEAAVQGRYDSGRVLLAPVDRVVASDSGHMEAGPDGRLRYRYCKSAVIAAWSIMASEPPPPAQVPTLIVLGADSWLTLDEHVDRYRATLGDLVEVVTVPGGHSVYWDALDETVEALTGFVR